MSMAMTSILWGDLRKTLWAKKQQFSFQKVTIYTDRNRDLTGGKIAIANYLHEWGGVSQFQAFIRETRERPRLGKAVSLPLDLGERASEWLISDQ